jgi:hypothetical protein
MRNLDLIPLSQWTRDEAYLHLKSLFDAECRRCPDLMEPYVTRLGELLEDDRDSEIRIMRSGLRETFKGRYS